MSRNRAFTLIELLAVIGIIAVLATIVTVAAAGALKKGRDAKRKSDLSALGRVIYGGCYMPDAGPGEYDLGEILAEVKAKNPQYANFLAKTPRDPKVGTDEDTGYRYILNEDGSRCVLFGNLENGNEKVTVTGINAPTPGGGTGVLQAADRGVNGTDRYFQVSN